MNRLTQVCRFVSNARQCPLKDMHNSRYRTDLYIGPAFVDWTSLTASKETCLEVVIMLEVEVWLENMNESQYK